MPPYFARSSDSARPLLAQQKDALMNRAEIDGVTLEYESRGSGDPVIFIHGALMGDTYRPLMPEDALRDYRFIGYHRRGYAASSRPEDALSVSDHAADCLALLRKLDAVPAHVVGHSSGGAIALQLALDAPEAVRSLAVLEPALLDVPSGAALFELLGPAVPMNEAGDKAGAVDSFLRAVCGKDYRRIVDTQILGLSTRPPPTRMRSSRVSFPPLEGGLSPARRRPHNAAGAFRHGRQHRHRYRPAHLQRDSRASARLVPERKAVRTAARGSPLQVENPSDMAQGLASFLHDVAE